MLGRLSSHLSVSSLVLVAAAVGETRGNMLEALTVYRERQDKNPWTAARAVKS